MDRDKDLKSDKSSSSSDDSESSFNQGSSSSGSWTAAGPFGASPADRTGDAGSPLRLVSHRETT